MILNLALHFLRTDERSTLDLLDASQQNMFAKVLSVTNTTFPNSTNFNDNFDLKRHYFNQFGRVIPYDFVNQVIPVTFGVTGKETVDVVTSTGKPCDTRCKVLPDNAIKGCYGKVESFTQDALFDKKSFIQVLKIV